MFLRGPPKPHSLLPAWTHPPRATPNPPKFNQIFNLNFNKFLLSILDSIWPPIWTENQPKVTQKCVLEAPWKKTWKRYLLRSKIYHLRPWKYSKNDVLSFKITLLAYSQRGQKNDPETSHFGEVFGIKIVPRSIKNRFEIVMKKHMFLIWFCIDLGSILDPWAILKSDIFLSFSALVVAPAPPGRQEGPQSPPRQPQRSIFHDLGPSWRRFWSKF